MAIYHLTVKHITRSNGKSAVASACYRAGIRATNMYDGVTHDYTKKNWITHTEVMLPEHVKKARPEYGDIGTLWNAVELGEKKSDARLATEIEIALPQEMTLEQQIDLVREYVNENFVTQGRCAMIALHWPPFCDDMGRPLEASGNPTTDKSKMDFKTNPHAHVMVTCRPIDDKGKWEQKTQIEYLCKRGNETRAFTAEEFKAAKSEGWKKQYKYKNPGTGKTAWYTQEEAAELGLDNNNRTSRQPKTTPYGRENPTTKHWNEAARVQEWRISWEEICNKKLKECGIDATIDSRSLVDQGRGDELPTVHMGPEAIHMDRKADRKIREGADPRSVLRSDKGKINEAVRKHNQAVRAQKKSEAVVTARLQGISNELGGISGELQSALATSKKIQSQLDHASRQTQADERQQEKMENMALQLASTIARTIAEIASMEAELSSVPLFDTARKKELKNKIHQSRQKLEDLKSYEASGKIMPVGNIQNEDIESLKSMDLQNQQDINNLTKQYEDIISKVPEAYKKELFFYMEGNQKSKEAKAHGKVFSNHHKSK